MHAKYELKGPSSFYFASNLWNAKSGKQMYNVCLDRQNVGQGFGPFGESFATASVKRTNHVAPSNSAFGESLLFRLSQVVLLLILLKFFPQGNYSEVVGRKLNSLL